MPKFEVRETRSVVHTLEVDGPVTAGDLLAARLDSMKFEARGCGGIIGESSELVSYTVHPSDDDEAADVVLDAELRDKYPPDANSPQCKEQVVAEQGWQ
jgi:hypothetical protein